MFSVKHCHPQEVYTILIEAHTINKVITFGKNFVDIRVCEMMTRP